MSKAKKVSSKSVVAQAYVRVRENEITDARSIKSKWYDELTVSFEDIDTDKFMSYCYLSLNVRRTTAERYLRKFRAIDRLNKKHEQPFATVQKLIAS